MNNMPTLSYWATTAYLPDPGFVFSASGYFSFTFQSYIFHFIFILYYFIVFYLFHV